MDAKNERQWRKAVISLGKYRGRSPSREGYIDDHGQIALPPMRADKINAWKAKLGIRG